MAKNTSISPLGDHFEDFVDEQVRSGRYGSASEVIRLACGCSKNEKGRSAACGERSSSGEKSGDVGVYSIKEIKAKACRRGKAYALMRKIRLQRPGRERPAGHLAVHLGGMG